VSGVEAETHDLGFGVGEEPLHPHLGVHMRVGMRVKDQLNVVVIV
jgi:hypothetical protein